MENSSAWNVVEMRKNLAPSWSGRNRKHVWNVWNAFVVVVLFLFDLLGGAFKKRHLGVSLCFVFLSQSQRHALHAHTQWTEV